MKILGGKTDVKKTELWKTWNADFLFLECKTKNNRDEKHFAQKWKSKSNLLKHSPPTAEQPDRASHVSGLGKGWKCFICFTSYYHFFNKYAHALFQLITTCKICSNERYLPIVDLNFTAFTAVDPGNLHFTHLWKILANRENFVLSIPNPTSDCA